MKLIVSGGRDYVDFVMIDSVLDELRNETNIDILNQGGATGADQGAAEWATKREVKSITHRANWYDLSAPNAIIAVNSRGKKYNKRAGINRNYSMFMVTQPDLVICFPGGTGTDNMRKLAIKKKTELWSVAMNGQIQIENIEFRSEKYGKIDLF